ncbi:MAG TPA: hypothetical protein VNA25_00515 [Phycisphaerae bacterium]|nr:hypothetical protein [Phycisphaerae bacterium]
MHGSLTTFTVLALATLAAGCQVHGTEGMFMRRTVPPDGRITLTDHGYRDWGPELVHYDLDTKAFRPGNLVLLDAAGRAVPFQGEGPFEAALDGQAIRIQSRGRARVLHVTQPAFLVRPAYWVDGVEAMACWTDYPASGWGRYANTWLIGLSVPEGDHELVVRDMQFPRGWSRPFAPQIPPPPIP